MGIARALAAALCVSVPLAAASPAASAAWSSSGCAAAGLRLRLRPATHWARPRRSPAHLPAPRVGVTDFFPSVRGDRSMDVNAVRSAAETHTVRAAPAARLAPALGACGRGQLVNEANFPALGRRARALAPAIRQDTPFCVVVLPEVCGARERVCPLPCCPTRGATAYATLPAQDADVLAQLGSFADDNAAQTPLHVRPPPTPSRLLVAPHARACMRTDYAARPSLHAPHRLPSAPCARPPVRRWLLAPA